jgi:hypothetical protein
MHIVICTRRIGGRFIYIINTRRALAATYKADGHFTCLMERVFIAAIVQTPKFIAPSATKFKRKKANKRIQSQATLTSNMCLTLCSLEMELSKCAWRKTTSLFVAQDRTIRGRRKEAQHEKRSGKHRSREEERIYLYEHFADLKQNIANRCNIDVCVK